MKKYYLLFLVFTHFVAYANDKVTKCSFDAITESEEFPLSRLVKDCKVIHFENIDAARFNPWFTTVTDKYIGVRQPGGAPYKLFDSSGKYLCDIEADEKYRNGNAVPWYDDWIDDKNQLVYLAPMSGDKIYVYNTSGKFVKNIVAPQQLHKPKLHLSGKGTLTVVHMAFTGEKAAVMQFDKTGQVIKMVEPLPHLIVPNYNGEIFNTRNTDVFEFSHTSENMLYRYNEKLNTMEPIFTLTFDPSEKPFTQYLKFKKYYLTNVFEKGKVVATDIKKGTSSFVKIRNDFFGNLSFPINVTTFRSGRFVYNIESAQLINEIEKRLKESDCSSQDKEKLTKLLESLDKESANVLFMGKLK